MVRITTVVLFAVLLCGAGLSESNAQIINPSDIEAICRSAPDPSQTHRSTIVYVDLSSIKAGNDEWGYSILKKLELSPRERITILGVNPSNFEVLEVFASCYPALTQSEIERIRNERTLWDKLIKQDPESQQKDNLQTFDARLRNSLDRLVAASKRFSLGKRRDMLGAIAVDKNRLTDRSGFYRIIVYTNGNISDDFEAGANETQIVDLLTKKYPTSFLGAEVSVFGVTGDDRNETLESKERIYSSYFLNNWARVRSFTPSLPQQTNAAFSAMRTVDGTFDGGGIKGSVKLSYAVTNVKASNIWLTFVVGGNSLYVPIEADHSCGGDVCSIKGTVIENIPLLSATPYFRKGDKLNLSGKKGEKLVGSLTSETNEVFKPENRGETTEAVKYQLEFLGFN